MNSKKIGQKTIGIYKNSKKLLYTGFSQHYFKLSMLCTSTLRKYWLAGIYHVLIYYSVPNISIPIYPAKPYVTSIILVR